MKTKQVIMAVLICILCAAAIVTAILGQSETQIITTNQNEAKVEANEIPNTTIQTENPAVEENKSTSNEVNLEESSTTQNDTTGTTTAR